MQSKIRFYDQYHQKNDKYVKVIRRGNFTYYYILRYLHEKCLPVLESGAPKKPVAALKVLDVGCGVGTISLYLATLGFQVLGVDVSERAIAICQAAKKGLHLKNAEFKRQELCAGKDSYDLVTCLEVIEHIEDDGKFLDLIRQKLKKGGLLLLTTPSKENFLYKLGFYKKFDREVGHERRYTFSSLKKLIEKHGFEVVEIRQTEGILRNILFTTKLGFLIRFIKGPLIPLFHFIDELTIPIFGASDIGVVARKR